MVQSPSNNIPLYNDMLDGRFQILYLENDFNLARLATKEAKI